MKKLLVVLVAVVFASCSQDQVETLNQEALETSLSVLDGGLLSYKDDASFIKEYSALSKLKTGKEVQSWISKKGHTSLLNSIDESLVVQDSVFDKSKIIYSDAIKAIVNSDSKFKIDGKVIWLNEHTFYKLPEKDYIKNSQELKAVKGSLTTYGSITNGTKSNVADIKKNSKTSIIIPTINGYSVSYSNWGPESKRYNLTIFNESILLNGILSSRMYVRTSVDYRSCSFWRCTWKFDGSTTRSLRFNLYENSCADWQVYPSNFDSGTQYPQAGGSQTLLLAVLGAWGPCGTDFSVTGTIQTVGLNGYIWTQTL